MFLRGFGLARRRETVVWVILIIDGFWFGGSIFITVYTDLYVVSMWFIF